MNDTETYSSNWLPICPNCGAGKLPAKRDGWTSNLIFRRTVIPPYGLRVWCWSCKESNPKPSRHWTNAMLAPKNWYVVNTK